MNNIDFSKINSLEKLFKKWKEMHAKENEASLKNTKHKDVLKDSFCMDGQVNPEERECDTLYIFKEVTLTKLKGQEQPPHTSKDDFLGKELLAGRIEAETVKRTMNKVIHMQTDIFMSDVNKMAFININKRGGASPIVDQRILNYLIRYKDFIAKEIEILNPKRIVGCGKINNDWLTDKIKEIVPHEDGITFYNTYHPSHFLFMEHYEKSEGENSALKNTKFIPFDKIII